MFGASYGFERVWGVRAHMCCTAPSFPFKLFMFLDETTGAVHELTRVREKSPCLPDPFSNVFLTLGT